MAHTVQTVTELIEKKSKPYWYIYEGGKLVNFNNEEGNAQKAAQELAEFFEGKTGVYDVVISDYNKDTDGGRKPKTADLQLRVKAAAEVAAITGPAATTGATDREIKLLESIAELKKQLIETEYKQQISGLQSQIDELKKGDRNPMLEMAITQLLPLFAGSGNTTAAGAAPVLNGNTDQAEKESAKAALSAAIKRLMKADPDYINTLEMVAEFAEKKPEQYASFKPILKSQL